MNNASHFKEILVHLKPNNFPRYIEQLTAIENAINSIDATKYQYKEEQEGDVKEQELELEVIEEEVKEEEVKEETQTNPPEESNNPQEPTVEIETTEETM